MKRHLGLVLLMLTSSVTAMDSEGLNGVYRFMADLQSQFSSHSYGIASLEELIADMDEPIWSDFIGMQTKPNLIGSTRLFHDCCNTLVDHMGDLERSYRLAQVSGAYREMKPKNYDNIVPVITNLMRLMITKCRVDINLRDPSHENTALHYIIKHADSTKKDNTKKLNVMIKVLLEAKADPSIKNMGGETPLDLCKDDSSKKILQDWIAAHQPANPATTTTTTSN